MRLLLIALVLCLMAGCAPAEETQPASPVNTPATAVPTAAEVESTVPAGDSPTEAAAPDMFANPVLDQDFPDPDVLKVGDTYYAYATNTGSTNIQAARSTDLVHWEVLADALPELPAWADTSFGWAWAPEVSARRGEEGYVMFFTARFKIGEAGGTQCIGAAFADAPEGPFVPAGEEPIVCQVDEGGSIDASIFDDEDGSRYLLWKNDGNSGGGKTWLYIQPLSEDDLTLLEEPRQLISVDAIWEGVLVEAPTLWKHGGKYYLFYSANAYNTPRYATGYATADSIYGPYTKAPQPLLKSNIGAGFVGPGGQDIVIGPQGGEWILFHGWEGTGYRRLYLLPLIWDGETPTVTLSRDPVAYP